MSNFKNIQRLNDHEDILSSQSSDEKMDTASESLLSTQNTPNSVLSSDFEERDHLTLNENPSVLRLQTPIQDTEPKTPNTNVLRLSEPIENNDNFTNKQSSFNDSLINKMANLKLDSEEKVRPKNLGISPPKFTSTLTTTTSHPLMRLGSPDLVENYPDVVPERLKKTQIHEEDSQKNYSISSVEETNHMDSINFSDFYSGPTRNTSKNNLYFSDNFSTAEDIFKSDILTSPPDVARVHSTMDSEENSHRRIVQNIEANDGESTPENARSRLDCTTDKLRITENRKVEFRSFGQSTPKQNTLPYDIPAREEFHSGVAEWCESPSHLRAMPNFELPIEMSTNISALNVEIASPAVSTPSDDKSTYQALLDPYSGNVALRHTPNKNNCSAQRRKIVAQLPDTEDRYSEDEDSVCSLGSEEADVPPLPSEPQPEATKSIESCSDEESRRNSLTDTSDPIPEYSAAEERQDTRSWLKVPLPTGGFGSCDMRVIEPYKRVLSHGGYEAGGAAIIVFGACHLPDCARVDYHYVMDNLFLYVIWTLERLVTDEYVLVYLHGSASRRRLPTFHWLHECYKLVDRRLRKNLKHLYLVHPTWWLKSIMLLSKPFVSSKFFRKVSYVNSIAELQARVPVDRNAIPDLVRDYDATKR